MKWIQARVEIPRPDDVFLAMELVSDLFMELGFQGVEQESTIADPNLDWADGVGQIPEIDAVMGYFAKNDRLPHWKNGLEAGLTRLREFHHIHTLLRYTEMDEEDWANSWKIHFRPERITKKIVVRPTWYAYTPRSGDIVLDIDPGMAFGTGTHPTTSLCAEMLEHYIQGEEQVLDVGTGSGILAIAAAKLGAGFVLATDMDPVAVEVARANLELNHIPPAQAAVRQGDLVSGIISGGKNGEKDGKEAPGGGDGPFDVVAANILADVILRLLAYLPRLLTPGGLFIASGIITEKRDLVISRMTEKGFQAHDIREKEGWVCIAGRLAGQP